MLYAELASLISIAKVVGISLIILNAAVVVAIIAIAGKEDK